jgi:hypothetical protein
MKQREQATDNVNGSNVDHLEHRLEQTGQLGDAEVDMGGAISELLDHTA